MSAAPQNGTDAGLEAGQPHPGQPHQRSRVAGLVTLAMAVLVVGLPLMLYLSTGVTLSILSWSPTYEVWLSVTLSLAIVATTGLVVWLGRKIRRRSRATGSLVVAAGLFAAVTSLIAANGALDTRVNDPHPTVVNASSNTIIVFTGVDDLRQWTTLAPGGSAQGDRPFLALDGCYRTLRLEARTPDGRVIDTRNGICNNDIWQITDPGASGS